MPIFIDLKNLHKRNIIKIKNTDFINSKDLKSLVFVLILPESLNKNLLYKCFINDYDKMNCNSLITPIKNSLIENIEKIITNDCVGFRGFNGHTPKFNYLHFLKIKLKKYE